MTLAADTLWIAEPDGQVTAVSPLTGKQLWQTRTGAEGSGQPTYDSRTRTLYLVSTSGRVAALDAREGTLLWETGAHAEQLASGDVIKSEVLPYGGALIMRHPGRHRLQPRPRSPHGVGVSGGRGCPTAVPASAPAPASRTPPSPCRPRSG